MMGYTRESGTNGIPVFQGIGKDIQLAQGGFSLITTGFVAGTVIPAGTPMNFDEAARTATALPTGIVYETAGGAATAYKINKRNTLRVGDNFASGAAGGKAYPITSIDTSNAAYDTITVGTTIGAVTAGDTVYASSATGATASAYPAVKGLLYDDSLAVAGESVSIVIRGTVYARRVPYSAALETALPRIIYSQSK